MEVLGKLLRRERADLILLAKFYQAVVQAVLHLGPRPGYCRLWCGPHTGGCGGPGCLHIGSACNARSGRTAPA